MLLINCQSKSSEPIAAVPTGIETLFTLLQPSQTNINFTNTLTEGPNTNILVYEYFYNGGGVATGDLNGDGLDDIYFSSNMEESKLYLNKGSLKFQDITKETGVGGRPGPWKTGVTMADVNGDGRLDLHLSYSGMLPEEKRTNQLFVNDGNDAAGIPKFKERSSEFGLNTAGYTTQTYFFDYDLDGDLDALELNHNPKAMPILNEVGTAATLKKVDPFVGIKLRKQTNGKFEDVTTKAGISSSALTYGLGAGISDLNNDGWPDIYISNDYAVPDYLYINNGNGTFTDKLGEEVGHNSQFSMGNEVADINNDGLNDIITLDMLPEDNHRQKILLAPDNYGKFDFNVSVGFHHQYMRNMLQLNNGNNTFSEIGQFAGISNTDWSWAPLAADFDNDGWKDVFITNGYLRDYTNLDFIKYMDDYVKTKGRLTRDDVLELIKHMPASNVVNYMFSNNGGQTFSNKTKEWGMDRASNSNGAAYSDLDNDGDLDVVVNNVNQPVFIYQNNSKENYLAIELKGAKTNTSGIGATLKITSKGNSQYREQMPARGYQSTVSPVMHFGLGDESNIDTLIVSWPGGKQQTLANIKANQRIVLNENDATEKKIPLKKATPLFRNIPSPIKHTAARGDVNDFKRQPLLINPLSYNGPCMEKADVNGDKLEDVFIGGGAGLAGQLFIQRSNGTFTSSSQKAFDNDKTMVDGDVAFADFNGDGFQDLFVSGGGYHNFVSDQQLASRVYINDGKGNFSKKENAIQSGLNHSKSCVRPADFDGDGDIDVFVGGRTVAGRYPEIPPSQLLINDGKGNFTEAKDALPGQPLGMVTDAVWLDVNDDKKPDLVVVGEWMQPTVLINNGKSFQNESDKYFEKSYAGWWNKIATGDFNNDGKTDLLIGNMGTNTQFRLSENEPGELLYADFDDNGSVDPLFTYYIQGRSYPYVTRDELLEQLGSFRKKYTNYQGYADAAITDIFKPEQLGKFKKLKATHLETSLFLRTKDDKFKLSPLPQQLQYSPVCSFVVLDFDKDGNQDIIATGNISHAKLRLGKFDANFGALLKGDGKGGFEYVSQGKSGFNIRGDVRSALIVGNTIFFGIGEDRVTAYTFGR